MYLCEQTGEHAPTCCVRRWSGSGSFLHWGRCTVNHLPWIQNHLADHLNIYFSLNHKRLLKPSLLQFIFAIWGIPTINLFITRDNKKRQLFCFQRGSQFGLLFTWNQHSCMYLLQFQSSCRTFPSWNWTVSSSFSLSQPRWSNVGSPTSSHYWFSLSYPFLLILIAWLQYLDVFSSLHLTA